MRYQRSPAALTRDLFLGFVKLHILHHASHEAVYGLWLIEELAGHGYKLSPGTLYPALRSLEKEGLLKCQPRVTAGKVRKYYSATRKGQAALAAARAKARILLEELDEPAASAASQ